jgi:arsenate reductase (glutaredoxin)
LRREQAFTTLGAPMLKFYQKQSCVSCKKARAYLERRGLDFEPIDITREPPSRELLEKAIDPKNPKASLNTRSGSFRKQELGGREFTVAEVLGLMLADPNLIRRPFFVDGDRVYQGFEPAVFETFLG